MRAWILAAVAVSMAATAQDAAKPAPLRYRSKIFIFDLRTNSPRQVFESDDVFEAPNWSPDGKYLLSNSRGSLFRIPIHGGAAEKIPLSEGFGCNNDHGFSPDGKLLAISAATRDVTRSRVFTVPVNGGAPALLTPATPSYFHGWSPDGKWLAFVGQRDGNFDLFRVAREGGEEQRLTSHAGYDDGPDYSPDGKWIYFNSDRAGSWDIWRIPAEGAGPEDARAERITSDDLEDWFPHPSPDGKNLLFVSFPTETKGHNARNLQVQLRMMPIPGNKAHAVPSQLLVTFTGGQGTINVNSWAPDSSRFAYVSYEVKP